MFDNGNITNAKNRLIVQSQKALYSVYYKIRNIKIPIDLQLKIFDALVAPILLYGSEVLGFEIMARTINMHTDLQISSCWEHIST